jgi:hypothetical protein
MKSIAEVLMVGVIGFEPTTPSPPAKCATKLRHTPTEVEHYIDYSL